SVCSTRSYPNCAIKKLDLLGNDACDVDKAGWRVSTELHVAQERLTTGEEHGALLHGKLASFVERGGVVIDKVAHSPRSSVLGGHCRRASGNRLDDVVIACAATDVALELFSNGRLVRLTASAYDIERHHHHAGRAVAALKRVMLPERRLHWMEWSPGWGQPLDGCDHRALTLQREHRARLHRQTVHMHDTGSALRGVATDVCARQAELFPEKVNEHRASLNLTADGTCIHCHRYCRHRASPSIRVHRPADTRQALMGLFRRRGQQTMSCPFDGTPDLHRRHRY